MSAARVWHKMEEAKGGKKERKKEIDMCVQ
jgi:hypothetical protein